MSDTTPSLPDFDALWNYDDPNGTESKFREILAGLPGDVPSQYRIELLTQIARTQGLQRQFPAAHETLDAALALLEPGPNRARTRYLLERGRALNSSGSPESAMPLFLEAWDVARAAHEDALAVDAAHMVAIVSPTETQSEWNEKALALAEISPDPRAQRWRGSLYNNIGWTYHNQQRYSEALTIFEKALAFRRESGTGESARIAEWCVARTLRSLGRIDEALAIQRGHLAALARENRTSPYVHEELGECLLLLGQVAEAHQYLQLAYNELSHDPWLAEKEPERIARLKRIAEEGPETKE